MSTGKKYSKDKFFTKIEHSATSGVIGDTEYEVWGETDLRVVSTFATSGTLTVQGRIKYSDTWEAIGTLAFGGDSDSFDISTYDYIRFNFTVAAGSTGEIAASGFFKGSSAAGGGATNSFTIFQTDAGTSPTADSATDTVTFTSSDSSIDISGNSTTDTLDITLKTTDITFSSSASSTIPLTLTGSASQTADLFRVEDSTNTQVAGVKNDGTILTRVSASNSDNCIEAIGDTYRGISMNGTPGANAQVNIQVGTATRTSFVKNGNTASGTGQYAWRSGIRGTSTIPCFNWSMDTDTGMYSPSANNLGFVSGTVQTMNLSSTIVESKLPLMVPAYATGSLPTASSYAQCIVYDSTTNEFKGSDGTSWNVLG